MMKSQMDALDVPPVGEFLDMVTAGGGEVYMPTRCRYV